MPDGHRYRSLGTLHLHPHDHLAAPQHVDSGVVSILHGLQEVALANTSSPRRPRALRNLLPSLETRDRVVVNAWARQVLALLVHGDLDGEVLPEALHFALVPMALFFGHCCRTFRVRVEDRVCELWRARRRMGWMNEGRGEQHGRT